MESTPYSPESEGDDNKERKDKDKKSGSPLRIPLPASEFHASEPRDTERLRSLFDKLERKKSAETPPEKHIEEPKEKTEEPTEITPAPVEIPAEGPHHDLAELHADLWQQENAEQNIPEPGSAADLEAQFAAGTAELPAHHPESLPSPAEHAAAVEPEASYQDGAWHEAHTIHINTPPEVTPEVEHSVEHDHVRTPEDAIPAAPSAEAMAAEVAATEPDALWEAFDAAPPAKDVPEWHPEHSGPAPAADSFEDIMRRADMSEDFVAATSAPEPVGARPDRTPGYGAYSTGESPLDTGASEVPAGHYGGGSGEGPSTPGTPPPPESGRGGPAWYPAGDPRRGGFGGSMMGRAAEAALHTGLTAANMAHAAETGLLAGAAAGAVAGGIVGHEAGKRAAHHQAEQLRQQMHEQAIRNSEQVTTLTNEQRQTQETVERLTQTNQQQTVERQAAEQQVVQQKAAAEAAAVQAAAAIEHERVMAATPGEKVVRSEWVDMVVDKRTGKLVEREGVNEFGDELRAEQRAESEQPDPIASALAAAQAAAQNTADIANYDEPLQDGVNPMLPSGQIGNWHELTSGAVDPNHRLLAPRSPVAAALTSPLLWVGVVVLLLAFFAAAFL